MSMYLISLAACIGILLGAFQRWWYHQSGHPDASTDDEFGIYQGPAEDSPEIWSDYFDRQ